MLAAMATPRQGLDTLRQAAATGRLDALCDRHGIDLLVAFGSATEGADVPRDLDVAVLAGRDTDLAALTADLMRLIGCSTVGVTDLRRAGPVVRARALGPGVVPLYERQRGVFARAQMAALAQELDTRWIRDLGLEALSS